MSIIITLNELANRLLTEKPSRALDAEIAKAAGWTRVRFRQSISITKPDSLVGYFGDSRRLKTVPHFCTDMGASISLIDPSDWWLIGAGREAETDSLYDALITRRTGADRGIDIGAGRSNHTPALALTGAALLAFAWHIVRDDH